jgi:hypothetical protein
MTRTLLIHRATNGPHPIFNEPVDVSINITALASEPAYKSEGVGLANTLWATLPVATIDAMMERFTQLGDEQKAELALTASTVEHVPAVAMWLFEHTIALTRTKITEKYQTALDALDLAASYGVPVEQVRSALDELRKEELAGWQERERVAQERDRKL